VSVGAPSFASAERRISISNLLAECAHGCMFPSGKGLVFAPEIFMMDSFWQKAIFFNPNRSGRGEAVAGRSHVGGSDETTARPGHCRFCRVSDDMTWQGREARCAQKAKE
jgi:hypothetical protein